MTRDIVASTRDYEAWLRRQTTVITADLRAKHAAMAASPFEFLRATFYRWTELWPTVCSDLAAAPVVPAVGDLHVENFGTWRDAEGRLVWGINDFDEAHPLAYTNDLVRLAVSARLARGSGHLRLPLREMCDLILSGYRDALRSGGAPLVLEEHNPALRTMALSELREPKRFWAALNALPVLTRNIPAAAKVVLEAALPASATAVRHAHRRAGLGSLGHQRVVALATETGAEIAREAKALVPSACVWARGGSRRLDYMRVVNGAVRDPDPFLQVRDGFVVRRLAPDCGRIELSAAPRRADEREILRAMGWECANVHLGGGGAAVSAVLADLDARTKLDPRWLRDAAKGMLATVERDHAAWVAAQRGLA